MALNDNTASVIYSYAVPPYTVDSAATSRPKKIVLEHSHALLQVTETQDFIISVVCRIKQQQNSKDDFSFLNLRQYFTIQIENWDIKITTKSVHM